MRTELGLSVPGEVARGWVGIGSKRCELFFRASAQPLAPPDEALLAAALLPAMALGEALRVPGAVSPRLLAGVETIQDIFRLWRDWLTKVPIEAEPRTARVPAATGVGCFFSGGVDSLYTALTRRDEISELIFVHGFDVGLSDGALRSRLAAGVRAAAAVVGRPLLEVETNLRSLSDPHVNWELCYGAGLASVALILQPRFRKVFLPADFSYAFLRQAGLHPLFPPLWSTEEVELVYDGGEASRIEKVERIAAEDGALGRLRVCWENRGGAYNCGRCEKCLRTMVNLRVVGALDRCEAFARPLDLGEVARMPIRDAAVRFFVEENLVAARAAGTDPELLRALERCVARDYRLRVAQDLSSRLKNAAVRRLRRTR